MGKKFIFVCQQCTLVAKAANCRAEHCRGAACKAKQEIVPLFFPCGATPGALWALLVSPVQEKQ